MLSTKSAWQKEPVGHVAKTKDSVNEVLQKLQNACLDNAREALTATTLERTGPAASHFHNLLLNARRYDRFAQITVDLLRLASLHEEDAEVKATIAEIHHIIAHTQALHLTVMEESATILRSVLSNDQNERGTV